MDLAAGKHAPGHAANGGPSPRINPDLAPINLSLVDPLRDDAAGKSTSGPTARAEQYAAADHDQRRGIPVTAPANPPKIPTATAPPAAAPATPPKVIGRPVMRLKPTYPTTPTPAPITAPAAADSQLQNNPLGSTVLVGLFPSAR